MMKRWLLAAVLCAAAVAVPAHAQTTSGGTRGTLPQIIDRDLFFGDPEIAGAQISPDGEYIAFLKVKVLGSESVTVPAGTFDAFKVEVATTDGPTATEWIAKDPRRVVKVAAILPQMNGATLTLELQK